MYKAPDFPEMTDEINHSNIIITDADTDDSSRLRQIALEANIDAWTAADYKEEIGRNDSIVLKAESSDNEILGFMAARLVPSNSSGRDAELYNIAVKPELQRYGIGALLIKEFFRRLRTETVRGVWLEVRASNSNAINFYLKHGFRQISNRRKFYTNPTEDAVTMGFAFPAVPIVTEM